MSIADQIIYEDNHLIALNKLPGQIVQGDKTGDVPLPELVKAYIKQRDNKPGNVFSVWCTVSTVLSVVWSFLPKPVRLCPV